MQQKEFSGFLQKHLIRNARRCSRRLNGAVIQLINSIYNMSIAFAYTHRIASGNEPILVLLWTMRI